MHGCGKQKPLNPEKLDRINRIFLLNSAKLEERAEDGETKAECPPRRVNSSGSPRRAGLGKLRRNAAKLNSEWSDRGWTT